MRQGEGKKTKILTNTDDSAKEFKCHGKELIPNDGPLHALMPFSHTLIIFTRRDFSKIVLNGLPIDQKFRADIRDGDDFQLTSNDGLNKNVDKDRDDS